MSKLIKIRAGHRGHVRKLVYEWPGLRVEKDAVLSEESRCRLEYIDSRDNEYEDSVVAEIG